MTYSGVVKNNVVILEKGAYLPDGVKVAVTVEPEGQGEGFPSREEEERHALVKRMKEFGQRLAGRQISLSDLIVEEREELENRA